MAGGFSFCGVNISRIGLEYAPELENTYVYAPAEYSIHDEVFDGHHGGYYYGAWAQPKEFRLRCIFESQRIDEGALANIYELFRVGRSGRLVFDRRPWCYYNVRVVERPYIDLTNYMNGLVTVIMRAYYPFARCDELYNTKFDKQILANTALFEEADHVPNMKFQGITGDTTIILANPGTEIAPVSILVAGNAGDSMDITNLTTGQTCSFVNITSTLTPQASIASEQDAYIVCDSMNGKTMLIDNNGDAHPAYLYHKQGFISLQSSYPIKREVYVNRIEGSTVKLVNRLLYNYEGLYIYIPSKWYKIVEQPDEQTLVLSEPPVLNGSLNRTMICRMNEINVHFTGDNINVTKLEFNYKPTFA